MITIGTKAILLSNGDEVFTTEGRMRISNIRMVQAEGIITYVATVVKTGVSSKRWAAFESVFNKVIEG